MALLFLYRDNNHHGEYNQNWSYDGLHHDTKHLLLGDSPSHSKLSFHLFDFTFGQKSSTSLETQLADSLAVVAEEQHRDGEVLRFSLSGRFADPVVAHPASAVAVLQHRDGGEGMVGFGMVWDLFGLNIIWLGYCLGWFGSASGIGRL